MFDKILNIISGILLGFVSGVVPGLHYNLIGEIVLSKGANSSTFFMIITILVASQFFEVFKSVFLLVPDESGSLGMHPIARMVRNGKAIQCVKLISFGSFFALVGGVIVSPILMVALPFAFDKTRAIAPFLLIIVSAIVIIGDRQKIYAMMIFISSGILGYFGFLLLKQPFLVLLTGLFGIPFIFEKRGNTTIEHREEYPISPRRAFLGGAIAFVSAFLLSLIPAVGPSHASIVTRSAIKRDEEFLFSIGAIGGFDIIFSIVLLYTVGKSRIGLLEMSAQLFTWNTGIYLTALGLVILISAISLLTVIKIARPISLIMSKIDSKYIGLSVLVLIIMGVTYFDGFIGLLFLAGAALIGTLNNKSGAAMSNSMGALIVPTLLLYLL